MAARQRKTLADVYELISEPMTLQPDVDPVVLVKTNDLEHEEALRKANSRRAQVLIGRHDKETDEWRAMWADVERDTGLERDRLIQQLVAKDLVKKTQSIKAELAATDKRWKDDQITGLMEAWAGGLMERYAADPEDPEAKKVFEAMKEFDAAVDAKVEDASADLAEDFDSYPDDVLIDKVVDTYFVALSESLWWVEFQTHRCYLATRWADKLSERHFPDRAAWDRTPRQFRDVLMEKFFELSVEESEGKDSPATQGSSPPSEQPDEAVISSSSGPAGAEPSKTSPTS